MQSGDQALDVVDYLNITGSNEDAGCRSNKERHCNREGTFRWTIGKTVKKFDFQG